MKSHRLFLMLVWAFCHNPIESVTVEEKLSVWSCQLKSMHISFESKRRERYGLYILIIMESSVCAFCVAHKLLVYSAFYLLMIKTTFVVKRESKQREMELTKWKEKKKGFHTILKSTYTRPMQ